MARIVTSLFTQSRVKKAIEVSQRTFRQCSRFSNFRQRLRWHYDNPPQTKYLGMAASTFQHRYHDPLHYFPPCYRSSEYPPSCSAEQLPPSLDSSTIDRYVSSSKLHPPRLAVFHVMRFEACATLLKVNPAPRPASFAAKR